MIVAPYIDGCLMVGPEAWDLEGRFLPNVLSFQGWSLDEECAPPVCLIFPTYWQVRLSTRVSELNPSVIEQECIW